MEKKMVKRKLMVICFNCKRIRTAGGGWEDRHPRDDGEGVVVSHGLCPTCARELYPEFCVRDADED